MKFIIVLQGTAYDLNLLDTEILERACLRILQENAAGDRSSLEGWELRDRNGMKLMDMSLPVSSIQDHGSMVAELLLQRTVPVGPGEIADTIRAFGVPALDRKLLLRKRLFMAQRMLANTAMDMRRIEEIRARNEATITKTLADLDTAGKDDLLTPDDLVYAATSRCKCGAGLASVLDSDSGSCWACSVILLGAKGDMHDKDMHDGTFPYNMYSIKEEFQPSANGATTRPSTVDVARIDNELHGRDQD